MKKWLVTQKVFCEEIKNVLRDEIAEKLISSRDIERYRLDKWKTKTKPKNENLSFYKPVEDGQPPIAVTHTGKSVIMNETSSNTETQPKGIGTEDNNEEGTGDADSKEESMVGLSLNDENASASKQLGGCGKARRKEVFVSHIPMSFKHLRKEMENVFQITKAVGKVWFKVSVDLGTRMVKIEFCGDTQQKNVAVISTGEGRILKSKVA